MMEEEYSEERIVVEETSELEGGEELEDVEENEELEDVEENEELEDVEESSELEGVDGSDVEEVQAAAENDIEEEQTEVDHNATLSFTENTFLRYCFPEGPFIPEVAWKALKAKAKVNTVIYAEALSTALIRRYDHFPLIRLTNKELMNSCAHLYTRLDLIRSGTNPLTTTNESTGAELLAFFGLEEYKVAYTELTRLSAGLGGRDFCLHFFQKAMLHVTYHSANSADASWKNEGARIGACRTLLDGKVSSAKQFDAQALLRAWTVDRYMPANFPPAAAATCLDLIAEMLAESRTEEELSDLAILDPCAGWGGRLLGFWFSERFQTYVGIDPNVRVGACFEDAEEWLQKHALDFRCESLHPRVLILRACSEDSQWIECVSTADGRKVFDCVLTSPPYYKTEEYDPEQETQSCNRFRSYAAWRSGFLRKMLRNATACLKDDGVVCLNVANSKSCPTLVADTAELMVAMGFRLERVATLYTPKRPQSKSRDDADRSKKIYEPVMFFRR